MLVLAIACASIGLAPVLFWPALARTMTAWRPAWSHVEAPAALVSVGIVHRALVVAGIAAAAWLWWSIRRHAHRRVPTWDCGYAAATSRFQYTAESFAATITEWFAWILRPERHVLRPDSPFPAAARHAQHTPETVLERVVEPAAGMILRFAAAVRRLQHGRVQAYLFYVVLGLALLAILVVAGTGP
jgi:hydrogenase-4 component B